MRVLLALALLCGFWTAASGQVLKPGDTISISVYQDPKLDRQIVIGESGIISFPLAGQIRAAGLTPQALERALRTRLQDRFTGDLDISVALMPPAQLEQELRPRFFVTGQVQRPGQFSIRLRTNLLQAIAMAGGFGPFAAKSRIQVRRQVRGAEEIYLFNYYAYRAGYNVEANIDLRPSDVIIVPERSILDTFEGLFEGPPLSPM